MALVLAFYSGMPVSGAARKNMEPGARRYPVAMLQTVDVLELAGVDQKSVAREDAARGLDKGPYRVGIANPVDVVPGAPAGVEPPAVSGQVRGTWELVEPGVFMWRLRVVSPDARWLSFGFSAFHLPPGATLFVYSPDYEWVAGPYSARDNDAHGQFWTPMIRGDEAVLELTIKASALDRLRLSLGSVTHGYRGFSDAADDPLAKSGACNVDVACAEGDDWRDQIRSVGLYTYSDGGGSYVCTGSLVNTTAADDTPYFLTANHCLRTGTVAASTVFYWEYESATCRTPGSIDSGTPLPRPAAAQSGALLRATWADSDFTLLELDDPPEDNFDVYWSGWDRTGADPASAACIHHPAGDEKRISHENDPLTTTDYGGEKEAVDGTHLRVADWDSGTTEQGSSGSGLWDGNFRIVGQLHGGDAACGNDLADWFGKFSVSWSGGGASASRLSDWLDPLDTGATAIDGNEGDGPPAPSRTTYRTRVVSMAFEDISATGTALGLGDDDHAMVTDPFSFPFYDDVHTTIAIGSNGSLYFQDATQDYQNAAIPGPDASGVDQFLAVYWDDLDPSAGGEVYYRITGAGPDRRLIVQWDDVPHHNSDAGGTFQAIVYEASGDMVVQYLDTDFGDAGLDSGASATAGVQDSTGKGVQYSFNQAVLTDGLAVRYTRTDSVSITPAVNLLLLDP
ncbi:hypothetical protein DSCA_52990 [Desulfosarcina alkanivorans]|uniref:Peptidase S1 domain-containing protein n=2 Tax=Desulfosarcina alkanivorans TaxID=571177 RepID=A0A5K7YTP7_9BACT|nr:hypothetical protein DSCA_52990 [Desulfosarcina alkanivorans]